MKNVKTKRVLSVSLKTGKVEEEKYTSYGISLMNSLKYVQILHVWDSE